MEGGRKKLGSVTRRRTRRQWDEYYEELHNELKRKKVQESGGDGGRGKQARNMDCSGPILVDVGDEVDTSSRDEKDDDDDDKENGAEIQARNMACSEPKVADVDDEVKISSSDEEDGVDGGGAEIRARNMVCSEPKIVDVDDEVKISSCDEEEEEEEEEDDGDGGGGGGAEIRARNMVFSEPKVVDVDDEVEFFSCDDGGGGGGGGGGDDDDDDEDDGAEILKNGVDDDADVGIGILRSDGGGDSSVQVSESGENDDDGIEFLFEKVVSNSSSLRNEAESRSGSGLNVNDMGERDGNTRTEADSLVGKVQIDRDVSIDSDTSKEDLDGSDELVSESETTSEDDNDDGVDDDDDDDEVSDEDYKGDESSSTSESSSSSYDSEMEVVKDYECGAAEIENLMERAEGRTRLGNHGKSDERESLRKENDAKQGKYDESDEGDHRTISDHCERRSNEHESHGETFMAKKGKRMFSERASGGDQLEKDHEIDEEKKKKRARKNKKGDYEDETHKSQNKETKLRKCSSSVPFESASSKDNEKRSLNDEGDCIFTPVKMRGSSTKSHSARDLDLIKILVDSINSCKEKQYNIDENALAATELPLRFRFEDEVVPPPEKSEWEKHLDSLFCDLELGLRESETDCTNLTMENDELKTTTVEIDESPAACCSRGEHHAILDEQIGIICKYCYTVIMDIKHVLPPFHEPTSMRRDTRYYYDEFKTSFFSEIQFEGSAASTTPDSTTCTKGTLWDLIPGVEKELYPHQREGFEFMWRNIGGDTIIEKLKQTLADDARGCIISHAPGTGKTRLTIVFLQTFLKLYPTCRPMIIAPKGMLLTWEAEFKKWKFNAAFHNLNNKELSGKENAVAAQVLGQAGSGKLNKDCIRLLKLYSWSRGGSILGISYTLFEKLAKENVEGQQHEKIREVLLEGPGLLVLDEGHTPRNERSLIWKALTKVSTQRRIILSGTPFQNNLKELYNILCVVNPKFANQDSSTSCKQSYIMARRKWRSASGIKRGDALNLRAMLDPFVHVHKGTILEESLPGLRHTLVFLHPTESQKAFLEKAGKEMNIFRRIRMVSLISVHPSINAVAKRYSRRRDEMKFDIDAGVKANFLFTLIHLSGALNERVLVFSQFIDSLMFIKEQLESIFSWNEGREVLYMDGQLDERKRQASISCFNDETSEAKVLLASEKACCEGINLIGASRVVLLDTVWNPSVEKQAISRAYRIGQKRVVHVYRLFTSGIEVKLRQYPQQIHKERISQWIFALGEGRACQSEKARAVVEDKVLDGMLNLEKFNHMFEKIISQPKESDLIKTFGLEEQK